MREVHDNYEVNILTASMRRCHNVAFFPQGAVNCIFLTPLENTVTQPLNCGHGPATPFRTLKCGNSRGSSGTSWQNPWGASRMQSGSVRRVLSTIVTVSHLVAVELRSASRFFRFWRMTVLTELRQKKMFDRVILSFTRMPEEKSHTLALSCGAKRLNS